MMAGFENQAIRGPGNAVEIGPRMAGTGFGQRGGVTSAPVVNDQIRQRRSTRSAR